ncbi:hypothetical protein GBAR_LOCUS9256, partial [Geodia barretti]
MSSSVATRVFLTQLPSLEAREPYFPSLLPPLCLNRHYVAEGVRLYCQETWKLVTEMKGVQLVEKYIAQVVEFYISQTEAANHAVREAACACIAELGTKVTPGVLGPHIPDLVKVLLQCFRDDSWLGQRWWVILLVSHYLVRSGTLLTQAITKLCIVLTNLCVFVSV